MTNSSAPMIFLSGAGGGAPDLNAFRAGPDDATRIEVIQYPGWRSYIKDGFSPQVLIAELVAGITAKVPQGPICIIGLSIGAHFGYAAALSLHAMGREIAGFCAIDSFVITSSSPSAGWWRRALAESWELLSSFRLTEFARFLRSRFWRALSRSAGGRLPWILRCSAWLPAALSFDPVFEEELNMRLLIRATASWIASLDGQATIEAPSIFLRTSFAAKEDAAWRRRFPRIRVFEIPGLHRTIFDGEHIETFNRIFVEATRDWHKQQ